MESVFLSYTYKPHPDHADVTNTMVKAARSMIEAMGLRVVDGVDLGGQGLNPALIQRIESCDALVALLTPQAGPAGEPTPPPFVADEYTHAKACKKKAIRLIHEVLPNGGMGQANEYIPLTHGSELDAAMKLMRTLSLWKHELGRSREIRIEPDDLGPRLDGGGDGCCQYKLMVAYAETDWQTAKVWHEPGGVYAYLPNVPEASKVRLKLKLDGEVWDSQFTNPMARVALARRQ